MSVLTSLRRNPMRVATLGAGALLTVGMIGMTAGPASAYGNPRFLNKLSASQPTGFPVSPDSVDLGAGPVTTTINMPVHNLTGKPVTVSLTMTTNHILTRDGVDISTGEPDLAFATNGSWVKRSTQAPAEAQSSGTFTVPSSGDLVIGLPVTLQDCGYYQFDARKSETTLLMAAGVIRARNCSGTAAPRLTPGYWKNHETETTALLPQSLGAYPVATFDQAGAVFDAMKCSNATDCLAGHLLAAELDVASGSATCINATIDEANQFLTDVGYVGPGSVDNLTDEQTTQALELKTTLDTYTDDSTSTTC